MNMKWMPIYIWKECCNAITKTIRRKIFLAQCQVQTISTEYDKENIEDQEHNSSPQKHHAQTSHHVLASVCLQYLESTQSSATGTIMSTLNIQSSVNNYHVYCIKIIC